MPRLGMQLCTQNNAWVYLSDQLTSFMLLSSFCLEAEGQSALPKSHGVNKHLTTPFTDYCFSVWWGIELRQTLKVQWFHQDYEESWFSFPEKHTVLQSNRPCNQKSRMCPQYLCDPRNIISLGGPLHETKLSMEEDLTPLIKFLSLIYTTPWNIYGVLVSCLALSLILSCM